MAAPRLHVGGQGNNSLTTVHEFDKTKRYRSWCFTKYGDEPFYDESIMKYLCYGIETCPTTGRLHYQSYVFFKNAKAFDPVRKLLDAHVAPIRGTVQDNIKYCSKDGEFFEFGERPIKGKRTDLIEIKNRIVEGTSVDTLAMENPDLYHQYGRTLERLETIALRQRWRTSMTEGYWYYGPTGVGKSHKAFENYHPETHYLYDPSTSWWDGYKGQGTVIINDYRGEIPYNRMLQLIDKWPCVVQIRNKESVPFISSKIIITSSLHPKDVYRRREIEDNIEQLLRRLTIIRVDSL